MTPSYQVGGVVGSLAIEEITRLVDAMNVLRITGVYGRYTNNEHFVTNFNVKVRSDSDIIIVSPSEQIDYFALRGGLGKDHRVEMKIFDAQNSMISRSSGKDITSLVNFSSGVKRVELQIDDTSYKILSQPTVRY
jgi:hypothetical protein